LSAFSPSSTYIHNLIAQQAKRRNINMLSKRQNNRRLFPGAKSPRPDHHKGRQTEAKERNEAWAALSPEKQLEVLATRPGESKRQRARILAKMNKAVQPVVEDVAKTA
jgi:hypothetical protein